MSKEILTPEEFDQNIFDLMKTEFVRVEVDDNSEMERRFEERLNTIGSTNTYYYTALVYMIIKRSQEMYETLYNEFRNSEKKVRMIYKEIKNTAIFISCQLSKEDTEKELELREKFSISSFENIFICFTPNENGKIVHIACDDKRILEYFNSEQTPFQLTTRPDFKLGDCISK